MTYPRYDFHQPVDDFDYVEALQADDPVYLEIVRLRLRIAALERVRQEAVKADYLLASKCLPEMIPLRSALINSIEESKLEIGEPITVCDDCGEICEIVEVDDSFSYAGTHCTGGEPGIHKVRAWMGSSCCEAGYTEKFYGEE